jgi:hypothetical protein
MDEMNDRKTLNRRYEAIAWGAVFVLIGVLSLIPGEQNDIAVMGIGIILLGLNLARRLNKIPVNVATIVLGIAALIAGLLAVLRPLLNFPFRVQLFPILLLAIGVIFFIGGLKPVNDAQDSKGTQS